MLNMKSTSSCMASTLSTLGRARTRVTSRRLALGMLLARRSTLTRRVVRRNMEMRAPLVPRVVTSSASRLPTATPPSTQFQALAQYCHQPRPTSLSASSATKSSVKARSAARRALTVAALCSVATPAMVPRLATTSSRAAASKGRLCTALYTRARRGSRGAAQDQAEPVRGVGTKRTSTLALTDSTRCTPSTHSTCAGVSRCRPVACLRPVK